MSIELSASHQAGRGELLLDGRPVPAFIVEPTRRAHQIGPLTVAPGGHGLVFHPAEPRPWLAT